MSRAGEFLDFEDKLHGPYELKAPAKPHYETFTLPGKGVVKEFDVGVLLPDGFEASASYPVMLCFGGGPQQRFNWEDWCARYFDVSRARGLAKDWILLAPIAPEGMSFMTQLVPDVARLIAVVKTKYNVEGDKVHIAGQSNGGNSVFAIGMHMPELCASMVVHTGVAHESSSAKLRALRNLPIFMYVGNKDCFNFLAGMQRTATNLLAAGHPPDLLEFVIFPDVGHFGILDALTASPHLEEFWCRIEGLRQTRDLIIS